MKRLLDAEYRKYARVTKLWGNVAMPYVEFRQQYLMEHFLPIERVAAFKDAQKQERAAQVERAFLRKQAGLPPLRRSKLDEMLIRKTKEHDDAQAKLA